jgi:hypothetical protein
MHFAVLAVIQVLRVGSIGIIADDVECLDDVVYIGKCEKVVDVYSEQLRSA